MSRETALPITNQPCCDGEMATVGYVQTPGLQDIVAAEVAIVFGDSFAMADPRKLSQVSLANKLFPRFTCFSGYIVIN